MFSSSPSTSTTTVITESSSGRRVHFFESCILIPTPPPSTPSATLPGGLEVDLTEKRVRIPTWARRAPSESNAFHDPEQESEGVRIILPRFRRSHSANGKRSLSSSPPAPPTLPSILRSPSGTPLVPKRLRRPSLPVPLSAETIPLRACCHECYMITEESANDPDWVEKFSKSAQRIMKKNHNGHENAFTLKVDEVDKIKKPRSPSPPPPNLGAASSPNNLTSDRDKGLRSNPRSSPIYEFDEDEAQLFPLPSPCRFSPSPSHTPSTTPPLHEWDSPNSNPFDKHFHCNSAQNSGRRSPLSSEILPGEPSDFPEEPEDVLSFQPSVGRRLESPIPKNLAVAAALEIPEHAVEDGDPGEDPDKIPEAFLSSYTSNKAATSPPVNESPSKLFSPFRRRASSTTSHSKPRSQEREASPEKPKVESPSKPRRQASLGFGDMLRGVTSVKSIVGSPSM